MAFEREDRMSIIGSSPDPLRLNLFIFPLDSKEKIK